MEQAAGEAGQDRHGDGPRRAGHRAPGRPERRGRRADRAGGCEAGVERSEDEQAEEQDERRKEDVGGHRVGVGEDAQAAVAAGDVAGLGDREGETEGAAGVGGEARAHGQGGEVDPVLAGEERLLDERRGGRAAGADLVDVGAHLHEPADEAQGGAGDEQRAQRTQRRSGGRRIRRTSGGTVRPSAAPSRGSAVAAPSTPPMTPHSRPSPKALPAEGETLVRSLSPPRTAKASMSRPNGSPTAAAHAIRATGGAPSVRPQLPARRQGDRADRDGHEDHRGEPPGRRLSGPVSIDRREQRADRLAEAPR